MTTEKELNEAHAPEEVWVTHHALDISEPDLQWLDSIGRTPWPDDYKAPITEWAANTRYIRADLVPDPAQIRAEALREAVVALVSAGRHISANIVYALIDKDHSAGGGNMIDKNAPAESAAISLGTQKDQAQT